MVDPDILRRVFYSTQTPPADQRGTNSNPQIDRLLELPHRDDRAERRSITARRKR